MASFDAKKAPKITYSLAKLYILIVNVFLPFFFPLSCQRGPPVDERFWKSYCVDTDPYQWPYITIYLKDMSK